MRRIDYIDGLRGLAISMVVANHLLLFLSTRGITELKLGSINLLGPFKLGFLGANLFFIVSGFLLAKKYLQIRSLNSFEKQVDFIKKRWIRISAVYYPILLMINIYGWLLLRSPRSFLNVLLHLTYLHALWPKGILSTPLLPDWFISDIMIFYIFFGLVITRLKSPKFRLGLFLLSFMVAKNFVSWLGLLGLASDEMITWAYKSPIVTWFYFMAGIIIFDGYNYLNKLNRAVKKNLAIVGGLGSIIFLLPVVLREQNSVFTDIGIMLLILSAILSDSFLRRSLSFTPLVKTGRLSYSIYLTHWMVIILLTKVLKEFNLSSENPLIYFGFCIGISVIAISVVANLCYVWLENKFGLWLANQVKVI